MTDLFRGVAWRWPVATVDQQRVAQETAAWLQRWRRKQGLSQRKASMVAGVTRNTFANWEQGRTVPQLFHVQRMKAFAKAKERNLSPKVLKMPARPPAKAGAR